jgi:hypothetical protein
MRTTDKDLMRGSVFCWAMSLLFFCLVGLSVQSQAQTRERKPGLSFSLSAGLFYPQERAFRVLYGTVQIPLGVQLSHDLSERICVFVGYKYLSSSGGTVLIGPGFIQETLPLSFKNSSLRFGATYNVNLARRSAVFVGGGASYNFFKEKWDVISLSREGKKFGFFIQTGNVYDLGKRFSLLTLLEYTNIPTGKGAKLQEGVNLGGLELALGLSVRL